MEELDEGYIAFDTPKRKRESDVGEDIKDVDDVDAGNSAKKGKFDFGNDVLNSITPGWLDQKSKMSLERKAPPLVRLHNEILNFCQFIAPTPKELEVREKVIKELRQTVVSFWPNATVEVFGSQLTSILIPSSDIDVAVLNVPLKATETVADLIAELAVHIRKEIKVSYIEAVVNARVPIIKYDHLESGISVDICINHDSGLRTGKFINDMMKVYPPLRPLTVVLKIFLTQRKMNDTYTGGIGSFLLSCMILSFLQQKQKISFYGDFYPSWNLGALLLEFLNLYGTSFNYYMTGISVREDGSYFPKFTFNNDSYTSSLSKRKKKKMLLMKMKGHKKYTSIDDNDEDDEKAEKLLKSKEKEGNKERPGLLCVENPDATDQDMGKNSYLLSKIRRSFEHAHQLLTVALNDSRQVSFLCYVIRANDPLILSRITNPAATETISTSSQEEKK